jgi:hypothetical protein
MELNFEGVDRTQVAVYKKGQEPNDVLFCYHAHLLNILNK